MARADQDGDGTMEPGGVFAGRRRGGERGGAGDGGGAPPWDFTGEFGRGDLGEAVCDGVADGIVGGDADEHGVGLLIEAQECDRRDVLVNKVGLEVPLEESVVEKKGVSLIPRGGRKSPHLFNHIQRVATHSQKLGLGG